jgi:catechol 2,3-dioxygenase-like lactoylglutathione lyase family enzyme
MCLIHHIEINVKNLDTSRRFYSMLLPELGYAPYQDWPKGFSFKEANSYIVFVQTEEPYLDMPYHRKASGLNHLAFRVDSPEVVDRLAGKLRSLGTPMLYEDCYPFAGGPGHYAVFLEDPDRLKIEIAAGEGVDSHG